MDKNIHFLGRRQGIDQIIQSFDIGVMLNKINGNTEGTPNAIMEYMAAGLPVVAIKAGKTMGTNSGWTIRLSDAVICFGNII